MDSQTDKEASSEGLVAAVVADDLTGAADTAIQFLPSGGEMLLLDVERPPSTDFRVGVSGLALNTVSRASGQADAVTAVHKAAKMISTLSFRLIYKKVDSQMRGRPGLEIETLRGLLGLDCAFIAPAYPEQGRLTRKGTHFVHDVPLAQGEAGHDPLTPVRESNLVRLVAGQAGVAVGLVPWPDLDQGVKHAGRKIASLRADGKRLIVFDVLHRGHLDTIARISRESYPRALMAGSAGLAGSMTRSLGVKIGPIPRRLPAARRLLFICGSQSRVLRRQTKCLAASGRCRELIIFPHGLSDDSHWAALTQNAIGIWKKENLLIRLSEETFGINPSALLDRLSELALTLIRTHMPDGLFLSGGDTARAVLDRAGVGAVRIRAQAMPGIAWGLAEQGTLDGRFLATKAGAFGSDVLLTTLYEKWIEEVEYEEHF